MKYERFAVYTVDLDGRGSWSACDGESAQEVHDGVRRAGLSWTPPHYYRTVTVRPMTGPEKRQCRTDAGHARWQLAMMQAEHFCEYTEFGLDPTTESPACGLPATVMNPRSRIDFPYEEWYCARHAAPGVDRHGRTCAMTMPPTTPEATRADLRRWRLEHGMSQLGLANELGVTRLTVARWETGTRSVPAFLYLALRELERQLDDEETAA